MSAATKRTLPFVFVLLLTLIVGSLSAPQLQAADVQWLSNFSEARRISNETGKPVLVHFYSNNCPPCKLLDAKAFKNPDLISAFAQKLVAVKINVDDHRDLADQYHITAWPTDVYLFPNGAELHRMVSPQDPAVYGQVVERVSLRNRDWVLEQNAAYAAQQKRTNASSAASTSLTPPSNPSVRTPSVETAPGQMPKPVIGRLASYPTGTPAQDEEPSVPVVPGPRKRVSANANPVPSQLLNEEHPVRSGLPPIRTGSNPTELDANDSNQSTLPAIVPANRYRTQPSPFQKQVSAQSSQPNPYSQDEATDSQTRPTVGEGNAYGQQALEQPSANGFNSRQPQQQQLMHEVSNRIAVPAQGIPNGMNGNSPSRSPSQYMTDPNTYSPNDRTKQVVVPVDPPSTVGLQLEASTVQPPSDSLVTPPQESIVFDGSCPVTLRKKEKWSPGNARFGIRHRGRIYYCESEEARQEFLAAPDDYSPVFSGYDIVDFLDKGMLTEGKKEFGCWFRGKVYLFASKGSYDRFVQAKQAFIDEIDRVQNSGRVAETPNAKVQR